MLYQLPVMHSPTFKGIFSVRCLVTGAAGFIGSTLSERLLNEGHDVVGVDCFIPYYPRALKDANLRGSLGHPRFEFHETDLNAIFDPEASTQSKILNGIDVVFHQAAQAGVRASWGADFAIYTHNNILATQKLLEACKNHPNIRVVYASSSSVYGETPKFPMHEEDLPRPVSPYGVSKLAAEHLMRLYFANFGVETVSLRYFTVYGPRQRPDMAFHRLCVSVLQGTPYRMFGTGEQTRDFTYVDDIVEANLAAAKLGRPGAVYNIGGGSRISMNNVIAKLEGIAGRKGNITYEGRESGDVTHTGADTTAARTELSFTPRVDLNEGLAKELAYIEQIVVPLHLK